MILLTLDNVKQTFHIFFLLSSSYYPYVSRVHTVILALQLPDLLKIRFYPFLPLDYPTQKRKSPVKSLATELHPLQITDR